MDDKLLKIAQELSPEQQLEMAKTFIRSWAWTGSNGSPYTEAQAKQLETKIQNDAWKTFIEIFKETP